MLATRSRVGAAPDSVCDSIREINDIGVLKCVFYDGTHGAGQWPQPVL